MKKLSFQSVVVGTFQRRLDAWGRLTLPTKWRAALAPTSASQVVMIVKSESCLALVSESYCQAMLEAGMSLAAGGEDINSALRCMLANIELAGLDDRGRIKIPAEFRRAAGLERDVVLLGCLNLGEVWNADRWKTRVTLNSKRS